jgi:hypothetical protein
MPTNELLVRALCAPMFLRITTARQKLKAQSLAPKATPFRRPALCIRRKHVKIKRILLNRWPYRNDLARAGKDFGSCCIERSQTSATDSLCLLSKEELFSC